MRDLIIRGVTNYLFQASIWEKLSVHYEIVF